jgi:hypothetical protein
MSNQQIATMARVQEKVKERIQASFMDLIPPELWEGMVQQHLNEFTRDTLPKLVKAEAENRLRELLKAEFSKNEWQSRWMNNGEQPSEFLTKVLKEVAPDLVNALFGRVAIDVVQQIRNLSGNRY